MGKLKGKPQILDQNERFRDKKQESLRLCTSGFTQQTSNWVLMLFSESQSAMWLVRIGGNIVFFHCYLSEQSDMLVRTCEISVKYVFELPITSNDCRKIYVKVPRHYSSKIEVRDKLK